MSLIAWYPLDGNAQDYTINKNHGTPTNVTWVNGKIGQAGSFNGSSSLIRIDNTTILNPSYISISGWIKTNDFNGKQFVGKRTGTMTGSYWAYFVSSGGLYFDTFHGEERDRWTLTYNFPSDEWFHLVLIYDGSHKKAYINGVEVSTYAYSNGFLNSSSSDLFIGRDPLDVRYHFDGQINDVRIYDHALSQKEINDLAKAKVLHYTFNKDDGDVVYDNSGLKHNGIVTGATWTNNTYFFDRVNDAIYTEEFELGNEFTFVSNIKIDDLSGTYQGIFWSELSPDLSFLFSYYAGYFHYRINNSITGWANTNTSQINVDMTEWNHIVFSFNAGTTKIYINGQLFHTDTSRGNYIGPKEKLYFGNRNDLAYDFYGSMDDIQLYATALSDADILDLYQTKAKLDNQGNLYANEFVEKGIVEDGLLMHLDASDTNSYAGTGTTWFDLSGNNNNVTLYNGVQYNANSKTFTFDGIDDYARTQNIINLSSTNQVSVYIFFKVLNYPISGGGYKVLYELSPNYGLRTDSFVASFADTSLSQNYQVFSSLRGNVGFNIALYDKTLLNDLDWHTMCFIHDTSQASKENLIYTDGTIKNEISNPISGYANNNSSNFASNQHLFFASRAGSIGFANIEVSSIMVYDRLLTPEEIQSNNDYLIKKNPQFKSNGQVIAHELNEVGIDTIAYEGLTYREIFETNNIVTDIDQFYPSGATADESDSEVSILTGDGSTTYILYRYNYTTIANNVYYLRGSFNPSTPLNRIEIPAAAEGYDTSISSPPVGEWTSISETYTSVGYTFIQFIARYNQTTTTNDVMSFKDIYFVNITDVFGVGNEPTQEKMDALYETYRQLKLTNQAQKIGKDRLVIQGEFKEV